MHNHFQNYNSLQYSLGQQMGNDGGDIPKRKQLVKEKQKVERVNAETVALARARFCNLTNQKLKEPLAIDRLGHIYNYESIVNALLKKNIPEKYCYIRKLSDIKKVIIERASEQSQNYISCPITKLQYNGLNKFVAIWTCGHVISRKAFKEITIESKNCIVCDAAYEDKDVIDLNLEGEQLQTLRRATIERKKKTSKQSESKNGDKSIQKLGNPEKKIKPDVHINTLDRLGGEFRDVLRERQKFKEVFTKNNDEEWKKNTFTVEKKL